MRKIKDFILGDHVGQQCAIDENVHLALKDGVLVCVGGWRIVCGIDCTSRRKKDGVRIGLYRTLRIRCPLGIFGQPSDWSICRVGSGGSTILIFVGKNQRLQRTTLIRRCGIRDSVAQVPRSRRQIGSYGARRIDQDKVCRIFIDIGVV